MVLSVEERRRRNRDLKRRSRANESELQKTERLQKQREYARRKRQEAIAVRRERQPSEREATVWSLKPVSAVARESVLKALQKALGPEGLEQCVCCVCDRWMLRQKCTNVSCEDAEYMEALRELLKASEENLQPELVKQYDCADLWPGLSDILLSRKGVVAEGDHVRLRVCNECDAALLAATRPKFAIKNRFFVGELLSNLLESSIVERLMTQLVTVVAFTRVMRGGSHRSIRSHCLAFEATPGPPATLLPRNLGDLECYRVVLAGAFTETQKAKVERMHCVRRSMVEKLLAFYKAHNGFYSDVRVVMEAISEESGFCPEYMVEANELSTDEVETEQDRVAGEGDGGFTATEEEEIVVERSIVFSEDRAPAANVNLEPIEEMEPGAECERRFLVRHSSNYCRNEGGDIYARMFPHLFPFGRGHPGEDRKPHVSLKACISHYCTLSSRRFAEDPLFGLVAFDRLSVQNMFLQLALKCKRRPDIFEGYDRKTPDQLNKALRDNEGRVQGRLPPSFERSTDAERFLKSVELTAGSLWGSDNERKSYQKDAFAYQARYGQPALFVTLTPNVATSFAMAHYSGMGEEDSMFDWTTERLPSRTELRKASLKNYVASALLFMRHMDAFTKHVLGGSDKSAESNCGGGLFGPVKAYFGMVETQGGGTLHGHFLVWLNGCYSNSSDFENALAREDEDKPIEKSIEAYADSIVSTDLALSVERYICATCGSNYENLEGLPIPPEAKTNSWFRPSILERDSIKEPLLVKCRVCSTTMSSQHIMKQILVKERTKLWPPSLSPLSRYQIHEQALLEKFWRKDIEDAENVVTQREYLRAACEHFAEISAETDRDNGLVDEETDSMYHEYLQSIVSPQGKYVRREDDPFREDSITRAIEASPPSRDDLRMSSTAFKFMVSTLVVLLNVHWWAHAGSCFKKSRMTSKSCLCRYMYPRDRVARTNFQRCGVRLCRKVACEFINGYNDIMMATFKSNHDIQVLLGGEGVTDRIYYCCKYVTKTQSQTDSPAAVALAALQRRKEKEDMDASERTDQTQISRKRVASLAFNLTNRQEVAGPLASLYLLRGSCCYCTATCVGLPLASMLKQLLQKGPYSCNLVPSEPENAIGNQAFQAASALDDYIFRPPGLEGLSVYEFTMKFFRAIRTQTTGDHSLFHPDHPLSNTHRVGSRRKEVVPSVSGPRMPVVDESASDDIRAKRSRFALILFKPFRTVNDLVAGDGSTDNEWNVAYEAWYPRRSVFVRTVMENMDDYFKGRVSKREEQEFEIDGSGDEKSDSDEAELWDGTVECFTETTNYADDFSARDE